MGQQNINIVSVTVQAMLFSIVSTALADCIKTWHQQALHLAILPYVKYALMAVIVTPPNFLFQEWLEETFPTRRLEHAPEGDADAPQTRFSKRSALTKFLLDQSIGAAVNTAAFIALASAWQDQRLDQIGVNLHKDFWTMLFAGWKFWPVVTLLNLCVVPWNWRPVVGNSAALCWGVYVTLTTG